MKLILVETMTMFHHRYAVMCEDDKDVENAVSVALDDKNEEFSQKYMGEFDLSSREITEEEYLKMFDDGNQYLVGWSREKKLESVLRSAKSE